MTATGVRSAFRDGIRRVNGAPIVLFGMFVVTLLVAVPLTIALRSMLEAHLGQSLEAEAAAVGTNYGWWREFSAQASGLGTTFLPSVVGFGAVLDNLNAFLDGERLPPTLAGVLGGWMVIWSFLVGGVLDRYARGRPTRAHGFFAACGTHFWRFLRLGIAAAAVYAVLFQWVRPWLFDDGYERLIRNMTVERSAFALRLVLYAVFGTLLMLVNVVIDYARIRIVVEDRRSALGALIAGARFVAREKGSVLLYLLNALAFLVLVLVYALAAPGAPRAGFSMWVVFAVGELYLLGRHYLKLLFYASETAFFQGALAHASYTAAPPVVWPDSPAAEAIVNADSAEGSSAALGTGR
jgi:hypothetical protein